MSKYLILNGMPVGESDRVAAGSVVFPGDLAAVGWNKDVSCGVRPLPGPKYISVI